MLLTDLSHLVDPMRARQHNVQNLETLEEGTGQEPWRLACPEPEPACRQPWITMPSPTWCWKCLKVEMLQPPWASALTAPCCSALSCSSPSLERCGRVQGGLHTWPHRSQAVSASCCQLAVLLLAMALCGLPGCPAAVCLGPSSQVRRGNQRVSVMREASELHVWPALWVECQAAAVKACLFNE